MEKLGGEKAEQQDKSVELTRKQACDLGGVVLDAAAEQADAKGEQDGRTEFQQIISDQERLVYETQVGGL